jgi:hypothetical protein
MSWVVPIHCALHLFHTMLQMGSSLKMPHYYKKIQLSVDNIPIQWLIHQIHPQHILNHLIDPLCFPILL